MEVKVSVDGVPRVVCGVTDKTTCEEVVIALAQALGQPGRYTLREKFKDFERSMTPNEHLLQSLEKYGQQTRDVQLTLLHNGPSLWDGMSRAKGGRYQPCPHMRKKDAGARMRRGSGSSSSHRQSLPPLSRLRQEVEQPPEDLKRPKRKSLTLMEEAWGWLEGLGKGKVHHSACDKQSKKTDKRNRSSVVVSVTVDKDPSAPGSLLSKFRGQKSSKSKLDHQTSCCMGNQRRDKESKDFEQIPVAGTAGTKGDELPDSGCAKTYEKNSLRETIMCQLACLQDLQVQNAFIDKQIRELEQQQRARKAAQEAQQKMIEEETEQIKFWENELKAEEGYEKDLQQQFLEMRDKAVECKAKLEGYKCKMQGLDFSGAQKVVLEDSEMIPRKGGDIAATETASTKIINQQRSNPASGVNIDRKFPPREDSNLPHALVHPSQIKERRPTGPTELREWWTRWSETQSSRSETKKVIHRSELTIYLGSTKV